MPRRYADHDPEVLLRAARLARLPGVTRAMACERFGLSTGILRRAVRELSPRTFPSRPDIVLHALTFGGSRRAGHLGSLAVLASYVDFVNKDGTTAADAAGLLEQLQRDGLLAVEGGAPADGAPWRLLRDFP